jgi:hypothetical protein
MVKKIVATRATRKCQVVGALLLLLPIVCLAAERRELEISATRDGIALVSVKVARQPHLFIVDTAGMTTLNSSLALTQVTRKKTSTTTAFGASTESYGFARITLDFGGGYFLTTEAPIHNLKAVEDRLKKPIGGVVGYDILRDWKRLTIDREKGKLILEK